MLPLCTTVDIANTLEEKKKALHKQFFPEPEADLSNITNTSFEDTLGQLNLDYQAIEKEIQLAISSQKSKGILGLDGLFLCFLKAIGRPLVKALTLLTTTC